MHSGLRFGVHFFLPDILLDYGLKLFEETAGSWKISGQWLFFVLPCLSLYSDSTTIITLLSNGKARYGNS